MSTAPSETNTASAQFARLLQSSESGRRDAKAQGMVIPSDKMKPVSHPPDAILRAYSDLLSHALVYFRGLAHLKGVNRQEVHDVADAIHNVSELLLDYGVRFDDEKYRAYYLRPFDRRWAHEGFGMEQFIESRLRLYAEYGCQGPNA